MTKQEEIGDYVQSFIEGIMEDCQRAKSLGKGSFDWGAYLVIKQQEFREGLASKGVVIKVDRELPELKVAWEDGVSYTAPYEYAQKEMIQAGYTAYEPLTGEE